MSNKNTEVFKEILDIGKNIAGMEQFLVEVRKDMDDRKLNDKEIVKELQALRLENQTEIRRFVEGINAKIEKSEKATDKRLVTLESDKKAVKWVVLAVSAIINLLWHAFTNIRTW